MKCSASKCKYTNDCSEVGQRFDGGTSGAKVLHESGTKTPRLLKNIFNNMLVVTSNDKNMIRKIWAVGYYYYGKL
jgi:hypothetical protein